MKTKVIIIRKNKRNTVEILIAAQGLSVSHDTPRPNMNRVKRLLAQRSLT